MRLPEVFMALLMLAAAGVASADPIDLKPFRATYIAEWKGVTAAGSTVELKNVSANIYTYSSVNSARGIFRMAFPDALSQTSTFKIVDGRVVPMLFQGSDEKERPINLTFDWQKKRVTGVAKERAVDLELPEGAQDAMSLQIASLRNLASGELQGHGVDDRRHQAQGIRAASRRQRAASRPRSASSTPSSTPASGTTPRASRAPGWRPPWAIYPSRPSASTARKC